MTTPTTRFERLLPDRWQGPSREARWRRARASRLLAALLVAAAALLVVQAVTPDAATVSVTVAARNLPAGTALHSADLKVTNWPRGASIPGALTASAAAGKVLTSAVSADEPLTSTRVRVARGWPQSGLTSAETTVLPVPLAAHEVAEQIHEGDRIDVFGASGEQVATALRVVARAIPSQSSATSASGSSPVVFVATNPSGAAAITRALTNETGQMGPLTVGLHISP